MIKYLYTGLLALFILSGLQAQDNSYAVDQDTSEQPNFLRILHTESLRTVTGPVETIRFLTGDVELRQDSTFMYCDSAVILDGNIARAFGNVLIQQSDSLVIFADSLYYDGTKGYADLFGNVVLQNNDQELWTDKLRYNLNSRVASYYSGALLKAGTTKLRSEIGIYYTRSEKSFFKNYVKVVDEDFSLKADSLEFDILTRMSRFIGPTIIEQGTKKIYCEKGFYDLEKEEGEFEINAQFKDGETEAVADLIKYFGKEDIIDLIGNAAYKDGERTATADKMHYEEATGIFDLLGNANYSDSSRKIASDDIFYNQKTNSVSSSGNARIEDGGQTLDAEQVDFDEERQMGIARGNVVWRDSSSNLEIRCEASDYNNSTGYVKAFGGTPLLKYALNETDTLFLTADTLLSYTDTLMGDSVRFFHAFQNVQILNGEMQAICDSLSFNERDSIFELYQNPFAWKDTTQFNADTLMISLKDGDVDHILLLEKGFIINSPDALFYNQIKGKWIKAFFEEGELDKMRVTGNAESVYYALDDGQQYIGVNKVICSDILFLFGSNEIEFIKFFGSPSSEFHPMDQVQHESLKLEGFLLNDKERPKTLYELWQ